MKRFFIGFLLIGAFLILSSCNNEESFSLSKDNRLVFSTDTLSLDTLFSNTSSSTYEFWLYNRNTKGVRLASVKLANGNQKGFRVNVNGIPLSNNNGFRVNAIKTNANITHNAINSLLKRYDQPNDKPIDSPNSEARK